MTRVLLAVAAALAFAAPAYAMQSACEQRVLQDFNNPLLRLQMADGAVTHSSREDAKVHLWRAQRAAETGDEAGCWDQRGWAAYLIKPPASS